MHDDHPKHTSNKKRLSLYYYASRLIVASFIVLAATIFPPFDASHLITQPDRKFGLTSALLRWDVFHFSNVAINGYTHEHLFAFFPGTPGLMKAVAETGLMLGRTLGSTERKQIGEGDVLLGGALASLVLCDWTGDLYDLTIAVGGTPSMAKLTALLSLVPLSPPTLLFAPYAEPFFARLSYKGILACHRRQWLKATFCFMLATSFRSNGTLLAGFIAWGMCAEPLIRRAAEGKKLLNKNLIVSSLLAILSTVIILLPFILHQTHGYIAFCTNSTTTPAAWCTSKPFPLIYSYVQKEYWDVGFLRYWTPSQIPNFLFAAPVTVLLLATSFGQVRNALFSGVDGWKRGTEDRVKATAHGLISPPPPRRFPLLEDIRTLPHGIHCAIFTCILVFASHVQIVLRLSSSMPYTYWAAASLVIRSVNRDREGANGKRWNWGRIWVGYVIVWGFVSMVLWAAFLPPA